MSLLNFSALNNAATDLCAESKYQDATEIQLNAVCKVQILETRQSKPIRNRILTDMPNYCLISTIVGICTVTGLELVLVLVLALTPPLS